MVNRVCRGWKAREEKEKSRKGGNMCAKRCPEQGLQLSNRGAEMHGGREEKAFPTTSHYPTCILCPFLLSFSLFFF